MNTLNLNTDRLIFVAYIGGAGGKFLINCLGLSDHVVFSDHKLVHKQLENKFTPTDKLLHLETKLNENINSWNDLETYATNLFELNLDEFLRGTWESFFQLMIKTSMFSLLSNQNKYFCIETMSTDLDKIQEIFPNAKIILFEKEYTNFTLWRNLSKEELYKNQQQSLIYYWNSIKGANWPNLPPIDQKEFTLLDPTIQQELLDKFNGTILYYYDQLQVPDFVTTEYTITNRSNVITWNANDYLSEAKFLTKIESLYNTLGLTDFNQNYITRFYRLWINTLDRLKQIQVD
jgi:hypothetical protein